MGSKRGSRPKTKLPVVQNVVKFYIGLTVNVLIVNSRWRDSGMNLAFKMNIYIKPCIGLRREPQSFSVHLVFLPVKIPQIKNIPYKEQLSKN